MTRGSSPLARGLRPPPRQLRGHVRIIPARAGFTTISYVLCESLGDHPRSRGVYRRRVRASAQVVGSSPLARGLREPEPRIWFSAWIIPARAGFTLTPATSASSPRDHPRSRGVYHSSASGGHGVSGSSPLARGLQNQARNSTCPGGIIPARAGFTSEPGARDRLTPDHPRSRGVYRGRVSRGGGASGSSPLARGLLSMENRTAIERRIIPARAGFTPPGCTSPRTPTDHPRSRGVYIAALVMVVMVVGSSPLPRGLQMGSRRSAARRRIIPARGGFTAPSGRRSRWRRDHPRSRGVYTCGSLVSQRTRSLSDPRRLHCRPRARSAGSP